MSRTQPLSTLSESARPAQTSARIASRSSSRPSLTTRSASRSKALRRIGTGTPSRDSFRAARSMRRRGGAPPGVATAAWVGAGVLAMRRPYRNLTEISRPVASRPK
jgi:hypothetical protein